jgi:uncharacterized protein (DUF433 family)
VGLTGLDSNLCKAVIRLKKAAVNGKVETHPGELKEESTNTQMIHEYGETIAKNIKQYQKHLTEMEISEIAQKYQAGKSTYELAKEYDCNRHTVSNTLKKQGIDVTTSKANRLDPDDIAAMYKNLCNCAEIAEKYGVGPNIIRKCLRAQGISIRGRWGQ